jgi:hypothetical protein
METTTKIELKYAGNAIKTATVDMYMKVGEEMVTYILPTMQEMKAMYDGVNGITYEAKQDGEGIRVIQNVDYTKFNEAEARKLAQNLGAEELDFYDDEYLDGSDFSLSKYKEALATQGFTCK